jgi:hypothetical protein
MGKLGQRDTGNPFGGTLEASVEAQQGAKVWRERAHGPTAEHRPTAEPTAHCAKSRV